MRLVQRSAHIVLADGFPFLSAFNEPNTKQVSSILIPKKKKKETVKVEKVQMTNSSDWLFRLEHFYTSDYVLLQICSQVPSLPACCAW